MATFFSLTIYKCVTTVKSSMYNYDETLLITMIISIEQGTRMIATNKVHRRIRQIRKINQSCNCGHKSRLSTGTHCNVHTATVGEPRLLHSRLHYSLLIRQLSLSLVLVKIKIGILVTS